MVKGGGRKPQRGGGHRTGTMEDFMERNDISYIPGKGKGRGKRRDDEEDEESSEDDKSKKKQGGVVLERDDALEAELAEQFGFGGLTRKQKEELEAQKAEREKEKAQKNQETEDDQELAARVAAARQRREEAARKREEEKAAAEAATAAAKATTEKSKGNDEDDTPEAVFKIAEIAKGKEDGRVSLNFLNQDNGVKKVLKPLLKKDNCKSLSKAWLLQFPKVLVVKEEGKDIFISAK